MILRKENKYHKKTQFSHSVDNILKLKPKPPNSNKPGKLDKL